MFNFYGKDNLQLHLPLLISIAYSQLQNRSVEELNDWSMKLKHHWPTAASNRNNTSIPYPYILLHHFNLQYLNTPIPSPKKWKPQLSNSLTIFPFLHLLYKQFYQLVVAGDNRKMIERVERSYSLSAHYMNHNILTGVDEIDNFVECGIRMYRIYILKNMF